MNTGAAADATASVPLARGVLHERVADGAAFVVSLVSGFLLWALVAEEVAPLSPGEELLFALDAVAGLVVCVAVWWRRRWPLALAVLAMVMSWSAAAAVAGLVLLWTVVVLRPLATTLALTPFMLASAAVYPLVHPERELPFLWDLAIGVVILAVVVLSALYVRARRQLAAVALERARRAVAEHDQQVAAARRAERARMAHEMHDVLAHRLSLLSMHAGALEYRPDAPPQDLAAAAGVVRRTAHTALQELREVIDVLREDPGADGDRPLPTLADLPRLVTESVEAGLRVDLVTDAVEGDPPAPLGRTVYRVVQEGLTNARKHAPGARVRVRVEGRSGDELDVEVCTTRPAGGAASGIPGAGTGLAGLRERVEVLGGTLQHGPTPDGGFRVRARLPWPAG